jgi:aminoglycoside phosphotransferase (APT) family kinase protein
MNPRQSPIWREALAQVPGAGSAPGVSIAPLAGGTTNATFRVATGEGVFVLRLHEPYSADLGVDRRREAVLHAAAAAAGLASRVIATDPAGRYLVSEFLDGAPWQAAQLADAARLRQLAQTFQQLHGLPAPAVSPLDLGTLLERHVGAIAALDPAVGQSLGPQVAQARDTLARQADAGRTPCIVHGDPAHSNLIGTRPLRLVDWEYAAVGDPLADPACLLAYYPQILPYAAQLLAGCGLGGAVTVAQLAQLACVYRLASELWYRRLELARRHPPPAH